MDNGLPDGKDLSLSEISDNCQWLERYKKYCKNSWWFGKNQCANHPSVDEDPCPTELETDC